MVGRLKATCRTAPDAAISPGTFTGAGGANAAASSMDLQVLEDGGWEVGNLPRAGLQRQRESTGEAGRRCEDGDAANYKGKSGGRRVGGGRGDKKRNGNLVHTTQCSRTPRTASAIPPLHCKMYQESGLHGTMFAMLFN